MGVSGIQDTIYNNSKIWLFYKLEGNDTIVEMNKNNKIANTHWIFNIDKRLTLKHILPHIKKLQEKKATPSIHDNGKIAHLYYSYVDTVANKLSLVLFDSVKYITLENNLSISLNKDFKHLQIHVKNNIITANDSVIAIDAINQYLSKQVDSTKLKIYLTFDRNVWYQNYIHLKATLQNLKNDSIVFNNSEYVYLE